MNTKIILFLSFISFAFFAKAQNEWNTWYFGEGAGLHFNASTPSILTDGQINTREGCATISDPVSGALLFYSDGTKIWDRNHNIMPNGSGIHGDYSSSQSCIVVPRPSMPNRYYLFTSDNISGTNGYNYCEIDMTLNGGLGDVIPDKKNVFLVGPCTEKLMAIKVCDYYWVIMHKKYSSEFYIYKISANGISSPSIQNIGIPQDDGWNGVGQLKLSPDGKTIVNPCGPDQNGTGGWVELFDFDIEAGIISNSRLIPNVDKAYGAEFSQSGKYLYVSRLYATPKNILQYNLQAGSIDDIGNSKYILHSSSQYYYGSLQMTPDNRIYIAKEEGFNISTPFLDVINSPDQDKSLCGFQENGIHLFPQKSLIGLPNFIPNFSYAKDYGYIDSTICLGDTIDILGYSFHQSNPSGIIKHPNGTIASCDSFIIVNVTFSLPTSNYIQTLCAGQAININGTTFSESNPSGSITLTNATQDGCDSIVNVQLLFLPAIQENFSQTLCAGQSININGTTFSESNPSGSVTLTNATQDGCDSIVNVNILFAQTIIENYQANSCIGDSLWVSGSSFQYDHPTGSVLIVGGALGGCDSLINIDLHFYDDTSQVYQTLCVTDTLIVADSSFSFNHPSGIISISGAAYTGCDSIIDVNLDFYPLDTTIVQDTICWYDSILINNHVYNFEHTEGFEVIPTDMCDSLVAIQLYSPYEQIPIIDILAKDSICYGETVTLSPFSTLYYPVYTWSRNGSIICDSCEHASTPIIRNDYFALFGVDPFGCELVIERKFDVFMDYDVYIPNVFSPNGDGFNDRFTVYANKKGEELVDFQIYDRWGNSVYKATHKDVHAFKNDGWDGYYKGELMGTGVYVYLAVVKFIDGGTRVFRGDVTLIR